MAAPGVSAGAGSVTTAGATPGREVVENAGAPTESMIEQTTGAPATIEAGVPTRALHTSSPGGDDPFGERVRAVEARLAALDGLEPAARTLAHAAVQGVVGVYGEALARIVAALRSWGERERTDDAEDPSGASNRRHPPREPLELLLDNELVAHLLILHELHPLDLRVRVERALAEAWPRLQQRGTCVEVESIEDGVLRLRVGGERRPSARTLQEAVLPALRRLAPEVERIEVAPAPALVQLGVRRS